LLSSVITDETVPIPQRATTAVGLGRIGTPSAIATLWRYSDDPDLQLRQSVIAGLSAAGDRALEAHPVLDSAKLQVATGIQSSAANAVVAQAIASPEFEISAIQSSVGRADLVPVLAKHLATKLVADDGDVITEILKALQSTDLGQREIAKLTQRPEFQGLLARVGP